MLDPFSFQWQEEEDYKYKIFPNTKFSARGWANSVLVGKCDSRCHSTASFSENVVEVKTIYQILEILLFGNQERA